MLIAVSAVGVAAPAPVGATAGYSLPLPAGPARDSEPLAAERVRGPAAEHGRAVELFVVG